jgi:stage IV sporulation protein FB
MAQAVAQWVLVVALFCCVMLHELGHALVARRYGCATREILLLPIGGIAQMERLPQKPAQELLIALAGPAVNIALAIVLGAIAAVARFPIDPEQRTIAGALVVPLMWTNLGLALFNLLPAFPMDGGRVLRAALASHYGRVRATEIASVVARGLAIVFVIVGLSGAGIMLSLVGMFVWFSAQREANATLLEAVLSHATVADAMVRVPHHVDAEDAVDVAARHMLADGLHELAVTDHGQITGVVTLAELAPKLATPSPHGPVSAIMLRDLPVVRPSLPLDQVLAPLEERGAVLVGDSRVIVGLLTGDQLAMFTALRAPSTT